MTAPISHGYPDWTRRASATDAIYVNATGVNTANTVTYGPFFVGDRPALFHVAESTTGAFRVTNTWSMDAAATQTVISTTYVVGDTGSAHHPMAVIAPYVKTAVALGSTSPITYNLRICTLPSVTYAVSDLTDGIGITAIGIAIGAGVNVDVFSGITYEGPALWYGTVSTGNFTISLKVQDEFGGVHTIDVCTNASPVSNRPVFLPPFPTVVNVNNAGAAGNYKLWLHYDTKTAKG